MTKRIVNDPKWNLVKFHGKFKDLIPLGFKFWKAFASNYRVYTFKSFNDTDIGWINVWQHRGGYIEIDDLHSFSKLMITQILNGSIENNCKPQYNNYLKQNEYRLVVNMKENTIDDVSVNMSKYENWDIFRQMENKEITQEQFKEILVERSNIWRKYTLIQNTLDMIKKMHSLGMINLETGA